MPGPQSHVRHSVGRRRANRRSRSQCRASVSSIVVRALPEAWATTRAARRRIMSTSVLTSTPRAPGRTQATLGCMGLSALDGAGIVRPERRCRRRLIAGGRGSRRTPWSRLRDESAGTTPAVAINADHRAASEPTPAGGTIVRSAGRGVDNPSAARSLPLRTKTRYVVRVVDRARPVVPDRGPRRLPAEVPSCPRKSLVIDSCP